ncbi:MAG: hypothetical protein LUI14_12005 [Lachnospiraceae bacterium]|nr:hypothetical protein [Lachnospiraceae bacterium]
MRLHWYQDLYLGRTYQGQKRRIIRMVEKSRAVPGLRLLLVRMDHRRNQLEIVPQKLLNENQYDLKEVLIIGAAFGEQEARELLVQIADQVFRDTGSAELKEYILEKG